MTSCGMRLSISFMFKYLGNLFKFISKMMVVFLVSILSNYLYNTHISSGFMLGFLIYIVGIYFWGLHKYVTAA